MHTRHCLSLLLLTSTMSASIAAGACGEYKGRSPVAPAGIGRILTGANSTFTLAVEPTQLFRRPAVGTACPSRQAFTVPFQLRLRSDSSSALFLNQVRFEFIDSSGLPGPRMAMRQRDLLSHFGSVAIPPLGSREFPFSFPVGCATQPVGNLSIFVETIDTARAFSGRTLTLVIR
jgi:hypothetical protein